MAGGGDTSKKGRSQQNDLQLEKAQRDSQLSIQRPQEKVMMLISLYHRQQLLNASNSLRLMQVGYGQTLKTHPEYQRRKTWSVGRDTACMTPCSQ